MHLFRLGILSLVVACAAAAEPMAVAMPQGPHPKVYLTPGEVDALRARVASQPWAQAVADGIVRQADAILAGPIDIPRAGGQWTHWYSCKKDGGSLTTESPIAHKCTVCGEVYTGWPYDDVAITRRHNANFGALESLGLAYTLTNDVKYAERTKAILLEYATFYRDLPLHDKDGTENMKSKARLFAQTLDESVALCHIAFGYDLVHDAPCFAQADHDTIASGFLRPLVETIQANNSGISNWQTWHNAGVAGAGLVLGDAAMVDWAFNGPSGVLFQLDNSVLPSGMWYEEAPSYHWYALQALVYTFEGAARAGMDIYTHPRVKKLFDAPMRQLFPDKTFPAIQDSSRSSIDGARRFYDVAFRRFDDGRYAALMEPRDSDWALIWGVDAVPEGVAKPLYLTRSSNDRSEGLAVLRTKDGQSAAFFDYGAGKSGHVHAAKLGLIWFTLGDERFVDPGRLPYGNPMHRAWFTQTIAHNTVVVNGKSQRRTGATLKAFAAENDFSIVRAECTKAYDGVVIDRTLALVGNTLLDIVLCSADAESTFDLPLHIRGTLGEMPASVPVDPLGDKDGYAHLADPVRFNEPLIQADAHVGESRIAIRFIDRSQCFQANGPGYEMQETLPLILRRQQGTHAVFAAAYQTLAPGEAPALIESRIDLGNATLAVGGITITVGGEGTTVSRAGEGGTIERLSIGEKGVVKE